MLATLMSGARVRNGEELEARVKRVAAGLRTLGLVQGQTVAILMRNDFAFLEIMLGAERAGVTAVPLNWHASEDELAYILVDSGARALFAHADLLTRVVLRLPPGVTAIAALVPEEIARAYRVPPRDCAVPESVIDFDDWVARSAEDVEDPRPPAFRLLYTSGSTGRPKGVVRLRGGEELNARFAREAREAHGLEIRPIRAVMTGPLYHSAPGSYAANCVRFGELLVLQPKFDAEGLLDLVERHRISHLHVVPTMFNRLLGLPNERRERFDASSLRAVAHGSAMCPHEVKRAMIDWWGPVIMEYYAATEIGIVTGCSSTQWLAHPGSVGVPPASVQVRIVSEGGEVVAPSEVGDIQVRTDAAPLVSYLNQPEATQELKAGDGEWVAMGDIGYLDADGFLFLCDRRKDLVIAGGVNIFPAEVEECLLGHPAVRDAVAFGIPDSDMGEAMAAVVELRTEGQPELSAAPADAVVTELQAHVRAKLGTLRAPRKILVVDRLAREDTGKLSRRKVRAAFLEQATAKAASA